MLDCVVLSRWRRCEGAEERGAQGTYSHVCFQDISVTVQGLACFNNSNAFGLCVSTLDRTLALTRKDRASLGVKSLAELAFSLQP